MNKKTLSGLATLLILPLLASAADATSTAPSVTITTQPPDTVLVTATSPDTSQQWTFTLPFVQWDILRNIKPPARVVPEINATSGTQAAALVLGGMLLGAEVLRRRRRSQPL